MIRYHTGRVGQGDTYYDPAVDETRAGECANQYHAVDKL